MNACKSGTLKKLHLRKIRQNNSRFFLNNNTLFQNISLLVNGRHQDRSLYERDLRAARQSTHHKHKTG